MNTYLSDLFFAMDRSTAEVLDSKGNFEKYDPDNMLAAAKDFHASLSGYLNDMGIYHGVPSPEEIVEDFYKRL